MPEENSAVDVSVLAEIINALNKLEPSARRRMLSSVATLYGFSATDQQSTSSPAPAILHDPRTSFAEDRSLSPKEFVWEKQPKTAIERVVCLAYYLTHYRGMQQFKTADIAALNMEAAQVKFSNTGMMVSEATRKGYLASVGGQLKQLTVIGEHFVRLLPDREAALEKVRDHRPRRKRRTIKEERTEE